MLTLPLEEVHAWLHVCKEQCEYFQQHGHRYRQKHLQNWLKHAWEADNKAAEKAILAIINRKHDRARWKYLNAAMKHQQGRSVQVVQVKQEDGAIREYTGQEEVHTAIRSNIHRKRFFLAEQAPICTGMLQEDFRYNADTIAAEHVLKGEYSPKQPINTATQELFMAIADIRKEVQKDSISTTITHRQWSDFGGKSNEETSSYRSGRHFGH
jgi:hypothetical protein